MNNKQDYEVTMVSNASGNAYKTILFDDENTSTNLTSGQSYIVQNIGSSAADLTVWFNNSAFIFGKIDIAIKGSNSTINYASSTADSNLTISGNYNTIIDFSGTVNASGSIKNTFIDATGNLTTGAYTSFLNANGATIVAGAKSQFIQSSNSTITTGSDSVFDTFSNGTINAGIKTIANTISGSDITLGRNSSIVTLTSSSLTTDGTGTTVGALKDSQVNWSIDDNGDFASAGYGSFYVTGSIQGTNYIHGQSVYASFGNMDASAKLIVNVWGTGSTVTGGQGNQSVTQQGSGALTFISAASNTGAFTAAGGTGADTFKAYSSMQMTGGTGAGNTFDIFKTAAGATDVIKDFTASARNVIGLSGFGLTQADLGAILSNTSVDSATGGTILHIDSHTTLLLSDVHDSSSLQASSFKLS
ncbi:hypothetical protein [Acetobacter sp.]|jgi:hypothetical protein|uniref:hypothetical protein n=1 Tax=Acetobacter sp. TaxID=440 RepID=UPI0025C46A03|nr:hypothetical protein [Acetobacter sp.]MCH4092686.1 hypothetical protein [Acetobacter sp.]MCI1301212.1 hypothetical protein [Acetobacter sp.]MCI1317473.1 hypothetical protein [Acetobacter sp.]